MVTKNLRSWVRVFLDIYYKSMLTSYKLKILRLHIKKKTPKSLENVLKRKIEGMRSRGKPRTHWNGNMKWNDSARVN